MPITRHLQGGIFPVTSPGLHQTVSVGSVRGARQAPSKNSLPRTTAVSSVATYAGSSIASAKEKALNKVRFESSDFVGIVSLANPPINLFSEELIEDLRAAVNQAKELPLRALLVRADGRVFSGGADVSIFKGKTAAQARARFTSHLR